MLDRQLFTSLVRRQPGPEPVRKPPVFPLPAINDQPPVLLVFDHTEMAIDLAYERHHVSGGPVVRPATRETTLYWVPRLTPVFVVSDGNVVYARQHPTGGHTIIVDHRNGWLTLYRGLEHMFVPSSDRRPRRELELSSGDILGYLGASKPGRFQPLHFELWRCNRLQDYDQVDPIRYMRRWHQLQWKDSSLEQKRTSRVA